MPFLQIKNFLFMLKLVNKVFKHFADFSKSGLKSNDCKEMGMVCWFNKIELLKSLSDCQGN